MKKETSLATPLWRLPAVDLKWLAKHRCEHSHSYLEHYRCYKPEQIVEPKILFFDLETTAHSGFFWGASYDTNIIEVIECGKILSYAAQWGDKKPFVRGWIDFKRDGEKNLVKELFSLFSKADYIVAHNGKDFDIKWCNTKFIEYNLGSPGQYKVIDTLTETKKYFKLPSYKLDFICDHFGLGRKEEHEGWPLWKKCIAGDKEAWKVMKKYNLKDVSLLYKVFNLTVPYRQRILS